MRLVEIAVRRDDPDMLDYDAERGVSQGTDAKEMKDAPYYVSWAAQSWEWYGDGDPADGNGRFKAKGDGGRVVAINVPTHEKAIAIAQKLDADYKSGDFEDKNVYAKSDDYYRLEYHGSDVSSMSKMDDYDKDTIAHAHPNFKPVDYEGTRG